jgi:hypothetical protein
MNTSMPANSFSTLRLSHVTFTGADDQVDPSALADLSREAPLIEWGVLLSGEREGQRRFPTSRWRSELIRAAPRARRAAHVCGPALLHSLAGEPLPEPYDRMQLNFSVDEIAPADLEGWLSSWRAGGILKPATWITQYSQSNKGLHERFADRDISASSTRRHAVLFDGSSGLGILPTAWPSALRGLDCGYAGGLGPETLRDQLPRIAAAVGDGGAIWIDMEASLRVEDRFDLERVRAVLELLRSVSGGSALVPGIRLRLPT